MRASADNNLLYLRVPSTLKTVSNSAKKKKKSQNLRQSPRSRSSHAIKPVINIARNKTGIVILTFQILSIHFKDLGMRLSWR
jgi:hypothetical protein